MVESTALEMRRTGNCTVGSNPTLSASFFCLTPQSGSDGAAHARRQAVALANPEGFELWSVESASSLCLTPQIGSDGAAHARRRAFLI